MKARLAKELSFSTPDQPGMLEKVSALIAAKNVNIATLTAYAEGGKAHFMTVTSNNNAAKAALQAAGFSAQENEVVVVELENQAGAAQKMSLKLKQAGINLNYIYGTTCECATCGCTLILSANDNKKAVEALNK